MRGWSGNVKHMRERHAIRRKRRRISKELCYNLSLKVSTGSFVEFLLHSARELHNVLLVSWP